jgi:hypothetical protein
MEFEMLLPYLQKSTFEIHPEQVQPISHLHTLFPYDPF